jgi:hypothetical protein
MSIFKNIFSKKENPINTNNDFWIWFESNARRFHDVVKAHKNVDEDFFEPLSSKLDQLKDGYFFATGMSDDETAELVLTPDGNINNIVFVEGTAHRWLEIYSTETTS